MPAPVEIWLKDAATGQNRQLQDDDFNGIGAGGASETTLDEVQTELETLNAKALLETGGSVAPQQIVSSSANVTRVASSATSVQMLAATNARLGMLVHNHSIADLFIKYGASADIAGGDESYTDVIAPGKRWDMPQPPYLGRIDAIWSSADGYAMVTEEV